MASIICPTAALTGANETYRYNLNDPNSDTFAVMRAVDTASFSTVGGASDDTQSNQWTRLRRDTWSAAGEMTRFDRSLVWVLTNGFAASTPVGFVRIRVQVGQLLDQASQSFVTEKQIVCFLMKDKDVYLPFNATNRLNAWGEMTDRADEIIANGGSYAIIDVSTPGAVIEVDIPATAFDPKAGLRPGEQFSAIAFMWYEDFFNQDIVAKYSQFDPGEEIGAVLNHSGQYKYLCTLFTDPPAQDVNVTLTQRAQRTVFAPTASEVKTVNATLVTRAQRTVFAPDIQTTNTREIMPAIVVRSQRIVFDPTVNADRQPPITVRTRRTVFAPEVDGIPAITGSTVVVEEEINLRASDMGVPVRVSLQLKGHESVDLTNANVVEWRARIALTTTYVTDWQACTVPSPKNGYVEFLYNADVPPGDYALEFRVTWSPGFETIFPGGAYYSLLRAHE